MIKIYHNPRCKTSRDGLAYLRSKDIEIQVVDYLKEGLTREALMEILLKSNLKPDALVRTQEELFRKELKGKKFTDEEWINILVENPKLLQRPILLGRHRAVLAQPPEKADILLK
ncbi:MAG: arsenate reductase family protein [Bacteroidota bacterium]|nr:MAG: arsenate reductase family protein [Bacteroidota bacterium]